VSAPRDRWVVCAEYAAGPFTAARAAGALRDTTAAGRCPCPHEVIVSDVPPAAAGRWWEEQEDTP